jgi:hypothetical protein
MSASEDVLVVPNAVRVDRDEVEANLPLMLVHFLDVLLGGELQRFLFAGADGLFGDISGRGSLLDFHEDEDFSIEGDEVELATQHLFAASDDGVPPGDEVLGGVVFSGGA